MSWNLETLLSQSRSSLIRGDRFGGTYTQDMGRASGKSHRSQTITRRSVVGVGTVTSPSALALDFDAVFGTGRSSTGADFERDRIGLDLNKPGELQRLCQKAEAGDFEEPLLILGDLTRADQRTLQRALIDALARGSHRTAKAAWADPLDELEYELGWRKRTGDSPHLSGVFLDALRRSVAASWGQDFPAFADLDHWLQERTIEAAAEAIAFHTSVIPMKTLRQTLAPSLWRRTTSGLSAEARRALNVYGGLLGDEDTWKAIWLEVLGQPSGPVDPSAFFGAARVRAAFTPLATPQLAAAIAAL